MRFSVRDRTARGRRRRGGIPLALVVLALASTAHVSAQSAPLLMPAPAEIHLDSGAWVSYGDVSPLLPASAGPVVRVAAARLTNRLRSGVGRRVPAAREGVTLPLTVVCACLNGSGLALRSDESYSISLRGVGAIVRAETEVGVLRAFATLTQLAQRSAGGFTLPRGEIRDAPRFPWRGLMIDVARHFQSLDALKRQIDAMELVKLNVLHLHLSDNEGFRVESRVYPALHAASGREFYTHEQLRALVAYAAERGVRIVPEIDLPGHSRALIAAYPALSSDVSGARTAEVNPAREETYTFVRALLTEIAGIFPDPCFHIGADEVNAASWESNPEIRRFMAQRGVANAHALQSYFTSRVHDMLRSLGKTMIGWDEVLGGVPTSVVVQSWRSAAMTARAAESGHDVIVSAGWYLDWLTPADALAGVDPLDVRGFGIPPGERAKMRGHRLERILPPAFERDTLAVLRAEHAPRVLGGEAAMWTELVTEAKLDATIWPRTAVVADRLWSARALSGEALEAQLAAVSRALDHIGVRHLSGPLALRQRLAPNGGAALERFAEALEPTKFYARFARLRSGSVDTTFTSLADVLPPESVVAARFNRLAREWSGGARSATAELRRTLTSWRDARAGVDATLARTPALREARAMNADLALLSAAALEALDHVERGTRPTTGWRVRVEPVIAKHERNADASRTIVRSIIAPQPASEVLLAPFAGLRAIIERAWEPRSGR